MENTTVKVNSEKVNSEKFKAFIEKGKAARKNMESSKSNKTTNVE